MKAKKLLRNLDLTKLFNQRPPSIPNRQNTDNTNEKSRKSDIKLPETTKKNV